MNYGKSAYLKVIDLERRLGSPSPEEKGTSYLELSKPVINESFSRASELVVDFGSFLATGESLCFQLQLQLESNKDGSISAAIIVDGVTISTQTRALKAGSNELVLLKTFEPLSDSPISLKLLLSTEDEGLIATLKEGTLIVLGASKSAASEDIELRAVRIGDEAVISYIDDQKLYALTTSLEPKQLDLADFQLLGEAKSHCICQASFNSQQLNLYRVDLRGDLYYKPYQSMEGEKLISSGVSTVFACPCPSSMDDSNLIVYIKSGECYYRSLREGVLVGERKLSLPRGRYVDVRAVSSEDSEYIYLFLSHENGSNYIAKSLVEASTGRIVETLSATYMTELDKYIDFGFMKERTIENLNMTLSLEAASRFYYNEAIERAGRDYLSAKANLQASKYKVVVPVNYGIDIDVENLFEPYDWATYIEDCEGFLPATFDEQTRAFIDNGWMDRWPFSEIRPCLIKDGSLVGYLNKDDFTLFEDGTEANITDRESGNVMIEFPKIYIRLEYDEATNHNRIYISNEEREGYRADAFAYKGVEYEHIYVSAYFAGDMQYSTNGFHSNSGVTPGRTKTNGRNVYTFFQMFREENYEMMTFPTLVMIQTLYILIFKRTNSSGWLCNTTRSTDMDFTTGHSDKKGMFAGDPVSVESKIMGLEDFFNRRNTLTLGLSLKNQKFFVADPYDPNTNYNPSDTSSFKELEETYNLPRLSFEQMTTRLQGVTQLGYISREMDTMSTSKYQQKGFSGRNSIADNFVCIFYGFCTKTPADNNGLFSHTSGDARTNATGLNFRLIYYPKF